MLQTWYSSSEDNKVKPSTYSVEMGKSSESGGHASGQKAGVVASPDLNELSSSLVSPQLSVCQAGGKTLLLWVNLGGQ